MINCDQNKQSHTFVHETHKLNASKSNTDDNLNSLLSISTVFCTTEAYCFTI